VEEKPAICAVEEDEIWDEKSDLLFEQPQWKGARKRKSGNERERGRAIYHQWKLAKERNDRKLDVITRRPQVNEVKEPAVKTGGKKIAP